MHNVEVSPNEPGIKHRNASIAERLQEGLLALADRIRQYDPRKDYPSFVNWVVTQRMLEINKGFFAMIPSSYQEDCTRVNGLLRSGMKPDPLKLAQHLGIAQDRVVRCIELINGAYGQDADAEAAAQNQMLALDPEAILEEKGNDIKRAVLGRFSPIEKKAILVKAQNRRVSAREVAEELQLGGEAAAQEVLLSAEQKIRYIQNRDRIEDFFE